MSKDSDVPRRALSLAETDLIGSFYEEGNRFSNGENGQINMARAAMCWKLAADSGHHLAEVMLAFANGDTRPFGASQYNPLECTIMDLEMLARDQKGNVRVLEEIYRELAYRSHATRLYGEASSARGERCMKRIASFLKQDVVRKIEENLPENYRYRRRMVYV